MKGLVNYLDQEKIKVLVSGVGTSVTYLLGEWDEVIKILVIMIILDYLTGILKATINKEISSKVGLKGITRKGIIFVVLIVAVMLDRLLNSGTWMFRTIVAYFYIANEGISILENCICLGLPIPKQIKNTLKQLKENKFTD